MLAVYAEREGGDDTSRHVGETPMKKNQKGKPVASMIMMIFFSPPLLPALRSGDVVTLGP